MMICHITSRRAEPTLDQQLDQLAEICKPLAEAIEAMPASTKDRYGNYMSAIAVLSGKAGDANNKSVKLGVAVALQRAGGNKAGIKAALRAMGVLQ